MADKKISALTGAATPLDGTEVLPIVQSGATVKVANNDLRPKQIQSNATSGVVQVVGPAAAATRVMTVPDANFTAARTDAGQTFTGNNQINGKVAVNSSTAATAALHLTGGQRMLTYSATAAASSSATITISQSDFNTTNIQGSMLVIAGGYGNNVTGNVLGLWIVGGLLFFNDPTVYTATAITNTVTAGGSMAFAQSGVNYTVTLTNTDATQAKTFRVSVIVNG